MLITAENKIDGDSDKERARAQRGSRMVRHIASCYPLTAQYGITPHTVTLTSFVGTLAWPEGEKNTRVVSANLASWTGELETGWYELMVVNEKHRKRTRWHAVEAPSPTSALLGLVRSASELRPAVETHLTLYARRRRTIVSEVELLA